MCFLNFKISRTRKSLSTDIPEVIIDEISSRDAIDAIEIKKKLDDSYGEEEEDEDTEQEPEEHDKLVSWSMMFACVCVCMCACVFV